MPGMGMPGMHPGMYGAAPMGYPVSQKMIEGPWFDMFFCGSLCPFYHLRASFFIPSVLRA
jgi:hypothetical protein